MTIEIEADRMYSLSEACKFLPSSRQGVAHVSWRTLKGWVDQGRVKTVRIPDEPWGRLFVPGYELQRLLAGAPRVSGKGDQTKKLAASEKKGRDYGIV